MNVLMPIDEKSHEEIREWLERALQGQETLPSLAPGESPHVGILRLEQQLNPATRRSLLDGSLHLVRRFAADGNGDPAYVQELLFLVAAFRIPEAVQTLAEMARDFSSRPHMDLQIRRAVLAALVDMSPAQPGAFWKSMLEQAPEEYGDLALAGALATSPALAVTMLPNMPDAERVGQSAALYLDLAWDALPPNMRSRFVQKINSILPRCGRQFARPVKVWTDSKQDPFNFDATFTVLRIALYEKLGPDSAPRTLSPMLASCEPLAYA